jgi:hypothetical protein
VLWFKPTVVKHYDLERDEVPEGKLRVLEDGKPRSSEEAADAYVESLKDEAASLGNGPATTVLGVTTATVAP